MDASKSVTAVACAAHGPNFFSTATLSRNTSIFMAEVRAIVITVEHTTRTKTQQFIVLADSLNVVAALCSGKKGQNGVFNEVVKEIMSADALKQTIVVCWLPGHSRTHSPAMNSLTRLPLWQRFVVAPMLFYSCPILTLKRSFKRHFENAGSSNRIHKQTRNSTL